MPSVRDFVEYIKKEAGVENIGHFSLVDAYGTFLAKIRKISSDKGTDPEKVHNLDEATYLDEDEWTKLEKEFNTIHSEHREELEDALSVVQKMQ